MGKKKGQSAMEYLMTYGWALLVIVIVIAVLLSLNVFQTPEQCIFDQQSFACANPRLIANVPAEAGTNKGALFADITNGNPKGIVIQGILCEKGRTAPPGSLPWTGVWAVGNIPDTTVSYQGAFNLGQFKSDSGAPQQVLCRDPTTATNAVVVLNHNDQFNGRIYIAYKFADDAPGVPDKIIGANIATRAQ